MDSDKRARIEKAKRIRKGSNVEVGGIDTLHGAEYAQRLIEERIPFRVDYPYEFQSWFYVHPDDQRQALDMLMKLRASKL